MPVSKHRRRSSKGLRRCGDKDGGDDVRTLLATTGLFVLWLLMSGLFKPLILFFGLFSVVVSITILRRMERADGYRLNIPLAPLRFAKYFLWLMVEIAKANWAVTKVILSRDMPIRQHLFAVPFSQGSDIGQVIFANSITLTPGTVTVETEGDGFLVHALNYDDGDLEALDDMDRRVTVCETPAALVGGS
jgi:multicomponent Na+:H+ antiporter subunit E